MIKTATLTRDQKPTAEQIKQIQEAAKRHAVKSIAVFFILPPQIKVY